MIQFKRFFSTDSAKAIKADKYGYLNGINYMAPHTTGGDFDLCGKSSAGCRSLCLGFYSGQAGMVKDLENGTNSVRDSRVRKAQYYINDRHAFMAEMTDHIKKLSNTAKNKNKALCVRLNGSTDLAFESMKVKLRDNKTVTELFPTIQFVDYTKHIKRLLNKNRPANYHLTFSLSETNKAEAVQALKLGFNVAVVFGHGLPKEYLGYPVIDGTEHDLRHLDPKGVIVGLDPKGSKAKNDQTGFVVRDY